MTHQNIWITSIKAQRLDGCPIEYDGSEFYYVESLFKKNSIEDLNAALESKLQEQKLALVEIISSKEYLETEWSETKQFPQIQKALENLEKTGEFTFALFISSEAIDFDEDEESKNDDVEWT